MKTHWLRGLVFLAWFLPSFVLAQGGKPPAAQTVAEKAKQEAEKGTEAFKKGQYEEALGHFTLSHSLVPHPAMQFNKCRCLQEQEKKAEAVNCFKEFVKQYPKDEEIGRAQAYITRHSPPTVQPPTMQPPVAPPSAAPPSAKPPAPMSVAPPSAVVKAVPPTAPPPAPASIAPASAVVGKPDERGQLIVEGMPDKATLEVNGATVVANKDRPLPLDEGEHVFVVKDENGDPLWEDKVVIKKQNTTIKNFPKIEPGEPDANASDVLAWVATGVAVVSGGLAVYFGVETSDQLETAKNTTSKQEFRTAKDEGEQSHTLFLVTGTISVLTAGVAAYFWVDSLTQPPLTPNLGITPDGKGPQVGLKFTF